MSINDVTFNKINDLLNQLNQPLKKPSEEKWMHAALGIDLANLILKIIIPDNSKWLEQLTKNVVLTGKLPPALTPDIFKNQKQFTWYNEHPNSSSARFTLWLFRDQTCPFEAKFYWLNESATKARIAASTDLTPNWEDSEASRQPSRKVSIDFFLRPDTRALLVVVKNYDKLRVLELEKSLSNTQKILLDKLYNVGDIAPIQITSEEEKRFEPQRTIHNAIWEAFALKEVNKRFFTDIAEYFEGLYHHLVKGDKTEQDAKLFACRLIGRLMFCWFLRKKEFINQDLGYFDAKSYGKDSSTYYQEKLKQLFFSTLNTPISERTSQDHLTPYLNGGLFEARSTDFFDEVVDLPEAWFVNLYQTLDQYNFTTDESTPDYEQVAIDPEMLGRIFENLLATLDSDTGDSARKATGAFYTPREIVNYMCKESLRQTLYQTLEDRFGDKSSNYQKGVDELLELSDSKFWVDKKSTSSVDLWGVQSDQVISLIREKLKSLKILDPACGSGAFPMGMLQVLLRTYERLHGQGGVNKEANFHKFDAYEYKKHILHNSIYGVDIEPMAVEISRLRFWLSLIVDKQEINNVEPFPNLDFKFVCANSLVSLDKKEGTPTFDMFSEDSEKFELRLEELHNDYYNVRGIDEKTVLKDKFNSAFKELHFEGASEESNRVRQLKTWHPFEADRPAEFFDASTMYNIKNGFDIIIGNPPYIHFEKITPKELRDSYTKMNYDTYARRGDIYVLFYEMGIKNLKQSGILSYITSNKWMRAGYGDKLRDFFVTKTEPILLIDLGGGMFDSATVDTNILIGRKK